MQVAEKEPTAFYKSGFPKNVQRGKYNLIINKRLKAARTRTGLSAAGVVRALGEKGVNIGQSTLQGYEADESSRNHRYPSIPTLLELAAFYGCSLDYLFGITDRYKPTSRDFRENDIYDILESRDPVAYKGKKLNKKQREVLKQQFDLIFA